MCTLGASQVVLVIKNPPANAGHVRDMGLIPGLGRSPGGGHGNWLQYSCLENPKDRETCRATAHGFAQSWTRLKQLSTLAHVCLYVEGDQTDGVRTQKAKQSRATNNSVLGRGSEHWKMQSRPEIWRRRTCLKGQRRNLLELTIS